MVEVPGGVLAVDAEGVLLPSEENFYAHRGRPLSASAGRRPQAAAAGRQSLGRCQGGRRGGNRRRPGAGCGSRCGSVASCRWPADPAAECRRRRRPRASMEPFFVLVNPGGYADPLGLCAGRKYARRALRRRESRPADNIIWPSTTRSTVPHGQPQDARCSPPARSRRKLAADQHVVRT